MQNILFNLRFRIKIYMNFIFWSFLCTRCYNIKIQNLTKDLFCRPVCYTSLSYKYAFHDRPTCEIYMCKSNVYWFLDHHSDRALFYRQLLSKKGIRGIYFWLCFMNCKVHSHYKPNILKD